MVRTLFDEFGFLANFVRRRWYTFAAHAYFLLQKGTYGGWGSHLRAAAETPIR
jgi:hypothetical protein